MFFVFQKKTLLGVMVAVMIFVSLFALSFPKPVSTVGLNQKLVVVDPGHGGMDGGGVGVENVLEKDLNLQIAKKLEQILTANGYRVIMTRNEDISLHDAGKTTVREQKNSDLKNRASIANEQKAGLFVSIHMNKFESSVDNTTQIIKIIEVRPAEPKAFKEAKGLITSAYQTELETLWLEQLREKYPVKVNDKLLEKIKNNY